jgi:hypothetical protein
VASPGVSLTHGKQNLPSHSPTDDAPDAPRRAVRSPLTDFFGARLAIDQVKVLQQHSDSDDCTCVIWKIPVIMLENRNKCGHQSERGHRLSVRSAQPRLEGQTCWRGVQRRYSIPLTEEDAAVLCHTHRTRTTNVPHGTRSLHLKH